jgi:hypothetical protein
VRRATRSGRGGLPLLPGNRQFGPLGSLHVAHISKQEGTDQKPFGSVFWHNGCRASWFARLAETLPSGNPITVGLYNRKANLGRLLPPVAYEISFTDERTTFKRVNLADLPDLAGHLSVRQRMTYALRGGALADEIQAGAGPAQHLGRDHGLA